MINNLNKNSISIDSNHSKLIEQLDLLPIHEYAFIKPVDIIFSEEVRGLCAGNACGLYGSSWACPPAMGTVEECRTQCLQYENALLFSTFKEVEDSYDIEGWMAAQIEHEGVTDQAAKIFRKHFPNSLILSTEGCKVCKRCTYPDEPCRFPDRLYPATEGYGILVMKQAQLCGIKYNNGLDTVTYFSLILF